MEESWRRKPEEEEEEDDVWRGIMEGSCRGNMEVSRGSLRHLLGSLSSLIGSLGSSLRGSLEGFLGTWGEDLWAPGTTESQFHECPGAPNCQRLDANHTMQLPRKLEGSAAAACAMALHKLARAHRRHGNCLQ